MTQQLQVIQPAPVVPGFRSAESVALLERIADAFSSSSLVPAAYRSQTEDRKGNITVNKQAKANCMVALNIAARLGADELSVMQNLHIIEGRPSWSSQYVIASLNGCGKFTPLRFDLEDLGDKVAEYTTFVWGSRPGERIPKTETVNIHNMRCTAWAIERETNTKITGPAVTIEMAVSEGWYTKNGSKWKTMPELMLRYRAASFFGKLYAPELLMGLTVEEAQDILEARMDSTGAYTVDAAPAAGPTPEVASPAPQPAPEAAGVRRRSRAAATTDAAEATIVAPQPAAEQPAPPAEAPAAPAATEPAAVINQETGEVTEQQFDPNGPRINAGQVKFLQGRIKMVGLDDDQTAALLAQFGVTGLDTNMLQAQFDAIRAELNRQLEM